MTPNTRPPVTNPFACRPTRPMYGRLRLTSMAIAVLGVGLIGSSARAATPKPVSPLSPATAACIKQAQATLKACSALQPPPPGCKTTYHTEYATCFAPGAGVTCVTDCWAARATCEGPAQKVQKACVATCSRAETASVKRCDPSDTACLTAAQAAFTACKGACTQQTAPMFADCANAFGACVGVCPNLSDGLCGNGTLDAGEQCDDGNTVSGDCCSAGCKFELSGSACTSDGNVCTDDLCDGKGACQHTANTASCDDGHFCTVGDTCQNGSCQGTARDCSGAADQCNAGVCDDGAAQCVKQAKADGGTCDDGDACTRSDTCQGGTCAGGNPVACTASDQCHAAGVCDPTSGACSTPAAPDGSACDDGNGCTHNDTCRGGSCAAGDPVVCSAFDACHVAGVCDATTGACSNPPAPDGTACDDANACTHNDSCHAGTCTGADSVVCAATDRCHAVGVCDPVTGACSNPAAPDGTSCDDGNACTRSDTCKTGMCTGGDPVVCAGDQCHTAGTCDPSTGLCKNPVMLDGSACDDSDACTQTSSCQSGVCTGADPVVCVPSDQCHQAGVCSHLTGQCSSPAKPDGAPCDDGDPRTPNDACVAGTCVGGALADRDGDGIPDIKDNCPDVYNPSQADANGNKIGDACECTAAAPGRCVAGGGSTSTDCLLELNPSGPPTLNAKQTAVMPTLSCLDGDPACDLDGKADGQCTFGISLCFDNADPRDPQCVPGDVMRVEVLSPSAAKGTGVDRTNALAIEQAAGGMGAEVLRGSKVIKPLVAAVGPNRCSPLVQLAVPAPTSKGKITKRIFQLRAVSGKRSDPDVVTLQCIK